MSDRSTFWIGGLMVLCVGLAIPVTPFNLIIGGLLITVGVLGIIIGIGCILDNEEGGL